jgi:glycosyltransferase involved in cell wall biosynthesis
MCCSIFSIICLQDDPAAFAESVVRLLRDNELSEHLSDNGRRVMENCYGWQVICRQMMEKIEQHMPMEASSLNHQN